MKEYFGYYRTKENTISAFQLKDECFDDINNFPEWVRNDKDVIISLRDRKIGLMRKGVIPVNDWMVKHMSGTLTVFSDRYFRATYLHNPAPEGGTYTRAFSKLRALRVTKRFLDISEEMLMKSHIGHVYVNRHLQSGLVVYEGKHNVPFNVKDWLVYYENDHYLSVFKNMQFENCFEKDSLPKRDRYDT